MNRNPRNLQHATRRLVHAFRGDIIGREIIFHETTTSTNDAAFQAGRLRHDPEGIVVVADSQTAGRGRFGRRWESPPGVNLYFTVLLRPPLQPREAPLVTLAAGTAAASAIREFTGLKAEIKWPNDIIVNSRKTGGILVEMKTGTRGISLLAAGIGINVNMTPEALPEDIRPFTTSLRAESGRAVDRAGLFALILDKLEHAYKILLNGDKRALINEWLRLNFTIGKKIQVKTPHGIISGVAEAINDSGELMIRLSSGELETARAGDVTVLKT
ncbi:MAG: biotin--[acetyl-CoA-carboxylase] ligase [Deferribacteres bacterium]|nr:biotin--[acetyl-CoA-carboxylase] ligase [Deferribacteres bacterium]